MIRALSILVLVAAVPSVAESQDRLYAGGGGGASFYDTRIERVEVRDFKLEESEVAWKLFAGIRGPSYIAVEGGYIDLGRVRNADPAVELKTSGWDLFGMIHIAVGPVEVFGKAGWLWWRSDAKFEEQPFEIDGGDFAWGLGAALGRGDISIRVEWESFELEGDDFLAMATAGVAYHF